MVCEASSLEHVNNTVQEVGAVCAAADLTISKSRTDSQLEFLILFNLATNNSTNALTQRSQTEAAESCNYCSFRIPCSLKEADKY